MSSEVSKTDDIQLSLSSQQRIHARVEDLTQEWKRYLAGDQSSQPKLSLYLDGSDGDERAELFKNLLDVELYHRRKHADEIDQQEYFDRFPDHKEIVQRMVPGPEAEEPIPESIGAYRVIELLGKGGFGRVYLALESHTDRKVAVKVTVSPESAKLESLLKEARTLAKLDHPHIVPMYATGEFGDERFYIVSKYIEGGNLSDRLKRSAVEIHESASILSKLADALSYAHHRSVYHRDIKPANILLDLDGKPYLTDFGLALTHEDYDRSGYQAGTYAYMSPEQVRGDSNSIDGRSDIFNLGVVFYQLLAGRLPFKGSVEQLTEKIQFREARPIREVNRKVPRELERICLKCLQKKQSDRYANASDLAEDLMLFLGEKTDAEPRPTPEEATEPTSITVRPKGLRSFDEEDQDFFLKLVPGPHNRFGVPESIAKWKYRIEPIDEKSQFSVGLIQGPSGCGKSSIIRAGLLPNLSSNIIPIYIDASARRTEERLCTKLRSKLSRTESASTLIEAMRAIGHGRGISSGRKVLIVIDQFEQWLHLQTEYETTELLNALHHCDGSHLQCLLLVRDDFSTAAFRFMKALDIPLDEGVNMGFVDLVSRKHARRVLIEFGRAFGEIEPNNVTDEQERFLDLAIDELAENDLVICIRLAVFSEMMKQRPWTVEKLQELGGAAGLVANFLEDKFERKTSSPEYREQAATVRNLLEQMVPPIGTDLKGQSRSYDDLRSACDGSVQADVDRAIEILDKDLKVITPVENSDSANSDSAAYYQLAHDFLVPSIRSWLRRTQEGTWQGRAQLCLQDRTDQWKETREARYLPGLFEYLQIQLAVRTNNRTREQKAAMCSATKWYSAIAAASILVIFLATWSIWNLRGSTAGQKTVEALFAASPELLPDIIDNKLPPYRRWIDDDLLAIATDDSESAQRKLRAKLALVYDNEKFAADLVDELLTCSDEMIVPIRHCLLPFGRHVKSVCWLVLRDPEFDSEARLRAAVALVEFEEDTSQWNEEDYRLTSNLLLDIALDRQSRFRSMLEPISKQLVQHVLVAFRDSSRSDNARQGAAYAVVDWAEDVELAKALVDSDLLQFEILMSHLTHGNTTEAQLVAIQTLRSFLSTANRQDRSQQSTPIELGKKMATAAAALARMHDHESMVSIFSDRENPESFTQFVHSHRKLGVDASMIYYGLENATTRNDKRAQYGLLLSLGEFTFEEVPDPLQSQVLNRLKESYKNEPNAAVHAASGWLLREWGFRKDADSIDKQPLALESSGDREWFRQAVDVPDDETPFCFTMVKVPAGEYSMGSPNEEIRHQVDERLHEVSIGHRLAVADSEATYALFQIYTNSKDQLPPEHPNSQFMDELSRSPNNLPMNYINWFEVARFCRWLTTRCGMSEEDQCFRRWSTNDDEFRKPPLYWPVDPKRNGFRLLTEAEWEYVCRAGAKTAFSLGSDVSYVQKYGWFEGNSNGKVQEVRMLRPNAFGLFDMGGNVFEWCFDTYQAELEKAADPITSKPGERRVMRGGSIQYSQLHARCAQRARYPADGEIHSIGFRLARTLPSED